MVIHDPFLSSPPFPPGGRCDTGGRQRVVFIQHCLLCSSADFVMNDPDQALGKAVGCTLVLLTMLFILYVFVI